MPVFPPPVRALVVATLVAWASPAAPRADAPAERDPFEIGPTLGVTLLDEDLTGREDQLEPAVGLRIGGGLAARWNWFADAQAAEADTRTFAGTARMLSGRGGMEWVLEPAARKFRPFWSGAWGYSSIEFDDADDYLSAFVSAGFGQHVRLGLASRLRWEVRVDHSLAPDGLRGEDLTQAQATVGLSWALTRGRTDQDHDGIADRDDRCAATPAGARVDLRGCPLDGDRDGIPDGVDACPHTPAGDVVEATGCPADADGDGVPDGSDRCPGTAKGAAVDAAGCVADADGDGVPDASDACPRTLRGLEVDERGCFLDRDRDGVYDGLGMDHCLDTPAGTPVDKFGCPLER